MKNLINLKKHKIPFYLFKNNKLCNNTININNSIKFNFSTNTLRTETINKDMINLNNFPTYTTSYIDNDIFNMCEAVKEFNPENLTNDPIFKYKISKAITNVQDILEIIVMNLESYGFGLGVSTVILACAVRLIFSPFNILSMKKLYINRLLAPDINDSSAKLKKLVGSRNKEAVAFEMNKLNVLKAKFNVKNNTSKLFIVVSQLLVMFSWSTVIYKFIFNLEDYPQVITGGMLWFKDLTISDPYFILPLLNSLFLYYNVVASPNFNSNEHMVRMRKYIFIMPLISLPTMSVFPSGLMLYFLVQSFTQSLLIFFFNSYLGKKMLKIPDFYLNNTKLKKLNMEKPYYIDNYYKDIELSNIGYKEEEPQEKEKEKDIKEHIQDELISKINSLTKQKSKLQEKRTNKSKPNKKR